MQYTAMIVKSDGWFAATVKELPGVHTQGKTIDEIKENLIEAIQMVLESRMKHIDQICQKHNTITLGENYDK